MSDPRCCANSTASRTARLFVVPPPEMLITWMLRFAAKAMAPARSRLLPPRPRIGTIWLFHETPAMPMPSLPRAAAMPAMRVPWPPASPETVPPPPTTSDPPSSTTRPARSGWVGSMPVSITAIDTDPVATTHASGARRRFRPI